MIIEKSVLAQNMEDPTYDKMFQDIRNFLQLWQQIESAGETTLSLTLINNIDHSETFWVQQS